MNSTTTLSDGDGISSEKMPVLFGLLFIALNRRIIKVLYFFSGFKFFAALTFAIGIVILTKSNPDTENATPIIALGGSIIGFGLVGAILATCFGKFGLVLLGLSAGFDLWQIFAPFVKSEIANIVVSLVLAIVFAVICFMYKRPMEILIAAFTGAYSFSKGLYLVTFGALALTNASSVVLKDKLPLYGGIAVIILLIGTFIGTFWHHFSAFQEARRYEHQPIMQEI